METNLKVRKVIAKDDERIFIESSMEEVENFIVQRIREEFNDKSILCIKFEFSYFENFEESESTSWFINPYYVKDLSSLIEDEDGRLIAFLDNNSDELDESIHEVFLYPDSYGSKISTEFIPEMLLTDKFSEDSRFLDKYYEFYNQNLDKNLSEKEFIDNFFKFLENY